ncbi:hypothetical protein BDV59DRAFT_23504 [Aspergillus ambiguus]|uniref:uncharacterized protein n=1 Tax=Aspergillus ambiguus TaxID=176160 RepID=UPI003CCDE845
MDAPSTEQVPGTSTSPPSSTHNFHPPRSGSAETDFPIPSRPSLGFLIPSHGNSETVRRDDHQGPQTGFKTVTRLGGNPNLTGPKDQVERGNISSAPFSAVLSLSFVCWQSTQSSGGPDLFRYPSLLAPFLLVEIPILLSIILSRPTPPIACPEPQSALSSS